MATLLVRAMDEILGTHRVGRATQVLPNGYCGLPVVKACPHASA